MGGGRGGEEQDDEMTLSLAGDSPLLLYMLPCKGQCGTHLLLTSLAGHRRYLCPLSYSPRDCTHI